MAIVTSIMGFSGSGKTRSTMGLMNGYDMDKVVFLRPSKKPMSYRNTWKTFDKESGKGHLVHVSGYEDTIAAMRAMSTKFGKKVIVIEDSTFHMTQYFIKTAHEVGYDKFTNNAVGYYSILKAAEDLDEDVRVYLINHLEETTGGRLKIKTIGKMLDEKVDIPSLLTVVLKATKEGNKHMFITQSNGFDDVKSPEGLFESNEIDNDLNLVDSAICEYWNIER